MLVGAAPEGGSGRGYRNLPPEAGYDNVFGDVLPQETKDVMGGLWGTTSNNSVTFRGPYPYHDEPVAGEAIACSFDNFPGGAFVLEWKGSSQPLYQEDVPGFATWLDGEVGNWQPFRLARTDAIRNSVDSTWVVTNELG